MRAGIDTGTNFHLPHAMAAAARHFWHDENLMVILAKDSFVDMLEAAAMTAPAGPLDAEELLAPSGVVFFERERIIPALIDSDTTAPVRAITWDTSGGRVLIEVLIDGHHERNNVARVEPPAQCYEYLYSMNSLRTEMWDPHVAGDDESIDVLLGFLRAVKAIAQSPVTEEIPVRPMKKVKARKTREAVAGRRTPVRVLALRTAEHGRYELEAAAGKKIRQHWVRGHWRNQWYATLEAHRPIWIDGFIKGDAALGTVSGRKVYVGHGDTAA